MKIEEQSAKCNFPIDMVYMWVDGNDEQWKAKQRKYKPAEAVVGESTQTLSAARWRENDELRYSLRSVERYAPWINHIYIVTDNQCPKWLNREHPKITIIDHTQILPADALPVFNSTAIESCLYKIPNLSEHFLLANDDTFFAGDVTPEIFFDEVGRPIVRLRQFNRVTFVKRNNYTRMLWRMQERACALTGRMIPYAPHHNIDAYRKSDIEHCVSLYKDDWHKTAYSRFRQDGDMHRSFVDYYAIATARAQMRRVGRFDRISGFWNCLRAILTNRYATDSCRIRLTKPDYGAILRRENPLMICMNDSERTSDADCQRMTAFLKELFPKKSAFEK